MALLISEFLSMFCLLNFSLFYSFSEMFIRMCYAISLKEYVMSSLHIFLFIFRIKRDICFMTNCVFRVEFLQIIILCMYYVNYFSACRGIRLEHLRGTLIRRV